MKYISGRTVRGIYTWVGWSGEVAEPIGSSVPGDHLATWERKTNGLSLQPKWNPQQHTIHYGNRRWTPPISGY